MLKARNRKHVITRNWPPLPIQHAQSLRGIQQVVYYLGLYMDRIDPVFLNTNTKFFVFYMILKTESLRSLVKEKGIDLGTGCGVSGPLSDRLHG